MISVGKIAAPAMVEALMADAASDRLLSDIYFVSGRALTARINGAIERLSEHKLSAEELRIAATVLGGVDAEARVLSGGAVTEPFQVSSGPNRGRRYRISMQSALAPSGRPGVAIVARLIPTKPPSLEEIGMSQADAAAFWPDDGLVLLGGSTGSGKTTTMAAVLASRLASGPAFIARTIEDPIEYLQAANEANGSIVMQMSPRGIAGGEGSARGPLAITLRENPDLIIVGESRDEATVTTTVEAAMTGHLVWTTAHVGTVTEIPKRMALRLPPGSPVTISDVVLSSRVWMVQKLEKSARTGERYALREWLYIDDEARSALRGCSVDEMRGVLTDLLDQRGTSFKHQAALALARGEMTESRFSFFEHGVA